MNRLLLYMVLAATFSVGAVATPIPDEKDYDESVRLPVRRLHPERQFDQAMKEMHKKHEAKAQKEEEKRAKKEAKKAAKNAKGESRVVATVQQPQSTADKSLMKELLSKDYSIKKYTPMYEEPKPITWKDDPVNSDVHSLLAGVDGTRKGGATLYTPKGISMANDANEVFFCFDSDGSRATSRLRLRVQYFADDPLYYSDIQFTIDGFNYSFHPSKPSRGKMGARMYWEQSEDVLNSQHKDLVYALSHCHWARMSLKGADGMNHVKMLTAAQLEAFTNTLELYRAMGGNF